MKRFDARDLKTGDRCSWTQWLEDTPWRVANVSYPDADHVRLLTVAKRRGKYVGIAHEVVVRSDHPVYVLE